ncbi:hypothetical protein JJB27_08355 [Campylobacter fetus subsp. venerealis]|nr:MULTISPECIES: hypothetical protein [Campylobacter]OCS20823.1 hypothetical protein CFVI97532_09910 [Campylobacter fetus subsp. venerealis cfvi97/532]MBK3499076.1 hypothetical protein [Campylobacter fetus subsp. venerealis]MBK3503035.1 hypothetical protein [Campylobacter fetus subsp. venerealis]OCS15232.1 hypothetical protein CfvWBT01109_08805 [Campylobacter fetus subsp. venerealis]OCS40212.1 hypothetical protein CFVI92203_08900 [Campylobacter fetus subsp. venerealis cfvi92/203]
MGNILHKNDLKQFEISLEEFKKMKLQYSKYSYCSYLVDGSVNGIVADPGIGKSRLTLGFINNILSTNKKKTVHIFDLDQGMSTYINRGYDKFKSTFKDRFQLYNMIEMLCIMKVKHSEFIQKLAKIYEVEDLRNEVFIFDSLEGFTENISSNAMVEIMEAMRSLAYRGAIILYLHHTQKSKGTYKGSTTIKSKSDTLFFLENLTDDYSSSIEYFRLYTKGNLGKNRDGDIRELYFSIDKSNLHNLDFPPKEMFNLNLKERLSTETIMGALNKLDDNQNFIKLNESELWKRYYDLAHKNRILDEVYKRRSFNDILKKMIDMNMIKYEKIKKNNAILYYINKL